MIRRLFTAAAVLSLLLCIGAVVLWGRGTWGRGKPVDRRILTFPGTRLWEPTSYDGAISVVTLAHWPNREPARLFTASLSEFGADYVPWKCPQYVATPAKDCEWHDFAWMSGVGRTELNADGTAYWCHRIYYVDVPPPLSGPMALRAVYFPHWSLVLAMAVLPFLRTSLRVASLLRRRARRKDGRCITCGYRSSGNTSGICSECGARVPPTAEVTA